MADKAINLGEQNVWRRARLSVRRWPLFEFINECISSIIMNLRFENIVLAFVLVIRRDRDSGVVIRKSGGVVVWRFLI